MKELFVTVQYDPQADRDNDMVRFEGVSKLTPKTAIAARNAAAGLAASAWVYDDEVMYRVVGARALRV